MPKVNNTEISFTCPQGEKYSCLLVITRHGRLIRQNIYFEAIIEQTGPGSVIVNNINLTGSGNAYEENL